MSKIRFNIYLTLVPILASAATCHEFARLRVALILVGSILGLRLLRAYGKLHDLKVWHCVERSGSSAAVLTAASYGDAAIRFSELGFDGPIYYDGLAKDLEQIV